MLRHRVDDEGEEQSEDDEHSQSDDVLFELPPDEVDEGLHGVDKPGEAGGWTTGGRQEMVYIFSASCCCKGSLPPKKPLNPLWIIIPDFYRNLSYTLF